MRTKVASLVNEAGIQLVNESANELIAGTQVTDYVLSAKSSKMILHGYRAFTDKGTTPLTVYLVNESGSQLADENGNELIARKLIGSHRLYAGETKNILHGG